MDNINNEDNINFLLDMRYNIEDFLHFFNDYLLHINEINNNLFENTSHDTCDNFIKMYNQNIIKNKINNLHSIIKKINNKISKDCHHEFIEDYIDDFLDRSQKINFCSNCFLQK